MKKSIDICKAISSKQQAWYEENNTWCEKLTQENDSIFDNVSGTIEHLRTYMDSHPEDKSRYRDKLNTDMEFQHICLPSSVRKDYKEVLKVDASINTAAIKHIVLKTALQMTGAFYEQNKTCRDCLVRAVFEELSDTESVYTAHAFLCGVELPKFSLSVNLSHIKDDVARDLQEQCRLILDYCVKKV